MLSFIYPFGREENTPSFVLWNLNFDLSFNFQFSIKEKKNVVVGYIHSDYKHHSVKYLYKKGKIDWIKN